MGGEWGATGEQAMGLACSASNANWGKCELGKTNSETVLPALQVQTIHKTLNCATKIKPVQQHVAIPPVGLYWICASPKFHPDMTREPLIKAHHFMAGFGFAEFDRSRCLKPFDFALFPPQRPVSGRCGHTTP